MKTLKTVLIIIGILIAIPLIVALFVRKDFSQEREIVINRPEKDVFNYVKLLKNQNNYSKWNMTDPNAKMDYKGTDGTLGFTSSWDSENRSVGKGEQTITLIAESDNTSKIGMDLHFIKPFDGKATAYIQTEAMPGNQTKVKWGFNSSMPYPMNILLLCNMDNHIGKDLATGLNTLKGVLEK